jgi:bloom syndrome protein
VGKAAKSKTIFQPIGKLITEEDRGKVKIADIFADEEPIKPNYIKADNRQWENHKKGEDYRLEYVLSKFTKIKTFKNNQKAIIKCGLENHNIFVCMPTGGGKSLTFQLLTFLVKGVYVCVLPLVSLIFDQEHQAKILGIEAYSLTANTRGGEVKSIYSKLTEFQQS